MTDAVITWVDGADPAHAARLADYVASIGGTRPDTARAARFNDAGEIECCVASLLKFAPWFERIHIVVDGQSPRLMQAIAGTPLDGRVRLVDHREIFAGFEQHLPTFNSRAIISVLWRIPGLAEHFVYFNDDFMLLQPVQESDFFRDGGIVLRGKWRPQSRHRWSRKLAHAWKSLRPGAVARKAGSHDAQEAGARLAGFDQRYYELYHNPYPFLRSTLERFFAAHPEHLERNVGFRLRSHEQFKTESLATHLEIANGTAIFDNRLRTVQLKPRTQPAWRLRRKMARADRDPSAAFGCVQSLELASEAMQDEIVEWLDRRIGRLDDVLAGSAWTALREQSSVPLDGSVRGSG